MGPMLITHRTPHGWFYWLDGSPPRIAISETSLDGSASNDQVFASATGQAARAPANLTVTTRIGDGGSLPPLEALFQRVADASSTQLEVRIDGADALANWHAVQPWLVHLEKTLAEAQPKLRLALVLNTQLAEVPPPFVGFHDASRARIILEITDDGLTDDESHMLADRAVAVADLGFLVRPRLVLTGNDTEQWDRRAECYRVACHGWPANFLRPLPRADGRLPPVERFPQPEAVAEFLSTIYSEGRHDLTHTQPFAAILLALAHGTAAVSRCGAAHTVALDSAGRFRSCEHVSSERAPGEVPETECSWGPLCSALSVPCEGMWRRNPPDTLMKWRRLFCRALEVLMPRIIADLTEAASSQRLLQTRAPDSRLRAAAEDGRLRVWAENAPAPAC